jgi:hypothetical protein
MSVSKEEQRQVQINKMRAITLEKNGSCLNPDDYLSLNTKLKFSCAENHSWECVAQSVINGRWCPTCAGVEKRNFSDVVEIVKKNSGILLSTEYKNNYTKLEVICSQQHKFSITPSSLFQGHWCRQCAVYGEKLDRRLYSIAEIKHICYVRNGRFLGTELDRHLVNVDHYSNFECFEGHVWSTQYESIVRGHWCPVCRVPNIDTMKVIAAYRDKPKAEES